MAHQVKPSARGELEITTLNELYLGRDLLDVQLLGRGFAWLDTGTMDSLVDAANFVQMIEQRQSITISAPEEIAYKNGWISREKLLDSASRYGKSPYGAHLRDVAEGKVMYLSLIHIFAVDILAHEHPLNYGFIGAYGSRTANFVAAKSDLILALGSRLDVRQVGGKRDLFAPNAKLIRVDMDKNELQYHVHDDELALHADAQTLMDMLTKMYVPARDAYSDWLFVCQNIRQLLGSMDDGCLLYTSRCV